MKIVLDYDPDTGSISADGTALFNWHGLDKHDIKNYKQVDEIIELRKDGFGVEDILKLKRESVI